jgi:competence protein ComEA
MDGNGPVPRSNLRIIAAAVLASLATAVVMGAVLLFVRGDDNSPIQVMLPTPADPQTDALLEAGRAEAVVRVYVSGAVGLPGVYTMGPDDRVADAIAAAGGADADAELTGLNLAGRVRDEKQYHVPKLGEVPPAAAAPADGPPHSADASGTGGGLINLNTASVELLDTLPGIGQALASAIVSHRKQNGPFRSVDEVTNVPRIGPAAYEKIRDLVTVGDGQ